MSIDELISMCSNVRGKAPHWRADCPACEGGGKSRPLSISEDAGVILLKCFVGCDIDQITRAIGIDLSDLFPPRVDDDQQRKPRVRKPWRASEVLDALRFELQVAWVILADVAAGTPINKLDRTRAGIARDRIAGLIRDLTHAH